MLYLDFCSNNYVILGSCLSYNFAEVVKIAVITYNVAYVCLFLSLKGNPIFKLCHLFGLMGFIYDSCSNSGHRPCMQPLLFRLFKVCIAAYVGCHGEFTSSTWAP